MGTDWPNHSTNCLRLSSASICQYPPAECALKERASRQPKLPGVQEPWVVVWQPANTALDPFNAMSINMPLRSRELFRYCKFFGNYVMQCTFGSEAVTTTVAQVRDVLGKKVDSTNW